MLFETLLLAVSYGSVLVLIAQHWRHASTSNCMTMDCNILLLNWFLGQLALAEFALCNSIFVVRQATALSVAIGHDLWFLMRHVHMQSLKIT